MEMYHQDMNMILLHNEGGSGGGPGGSCSSSSTNNGGADGGGNGSGVPTTTNTTTPLKKGPWTAAEDAILTEYVRKHGEGNWNAVMRNSGLARCGKSCRLRWANHLRPNLRKGSFSHDEERLIVQLHAKCGNKWARMAAQLPGRTDNEIKNYWNTRIKRRQRQGLPLYPSDVQPEHPQAQEQQMRSQKHQLQNLNHHHHQQQQQQQLSPQYQSLSSPSPLAQSQPTTPMSQIPSTPTTPTTPTSSFSFQTQLLSSSPTPPSLSPTPPSLSPTPQHHSPLPSPDHTYSTLPLFDPFSITRNPPLLTNSFRFRRHSLYNIGNNHTSIAPAVHCTPFSVPSSPISGCSPPLPQAGTSSPLCRFPSFQFSTMPMVPSVVPESVYSAKLELPSSQLLSQNENSDITFDPKANISGSCGLLEDLLEEAHKLTNSESMNRPVSLESQEDSRVFNGFGGQWGNSTSSVSLSSAAVKPQKAEATEQTNTVHEDLSKFFNGIPSSTMQATEWYSDSGEFSNGHSSVITDENLGLDMQHMASLFPVGTSTDPSGSCSWDNMPGIC